MLEIASGNVQRIRHFVMALWRAHVQNNRASTVRLWPIAALKTGFERRECLLVMRADIRLDPVSAYRSEAAVRLLDCKKAASDPKRTLG